MKTFENDLRARTAAGGITRIMNPVGRFSPRIMFSPNADGSATADEIAAAAEATAKAAADKAAADKAAADKAAADKAEADRLAAEETARLEREKNMTTAEKEKADLLREVMDKKNKLKTTQAELEAAKAEAAKFTGINLEEVQALLAEKAEREKTEAEKKGEFDRVKQMMIDEHNKREKALQDQIAALTTEKSAAMSTIDTLTIGRDFATSKFISQELVLTPEKARVVYGSHFEVKDGETVAYDKPAGAKDRTVMHGGDGKPLPFDEALKKIVEKDPEREQMLKVKMQPGGGSTTTTHERQEKKDEVKGVFGVERIRAALAKKAAAS